MSDHENNIGNAPMSVGGSLSEEQARIAEIHRGFVREMDRSLGNAYGTGGGTVLGVLVSVLIAGWWMGWLTSVILWVSGVTAVLAALYMVRRRIHAKRDKLRRRVEKYCEVNDVSVDLLCLYFEQDQTYPFFCDIFQEPPHQPLEHQQQVSEQT